MTSYAGNTHEIDYGLKVLTMGMVWLLIQTEILGQINGFPKIL